METTRQNKIARLLQKELSDIFLLQTKSMSTDLCQCCAYQPGLECRTCLSEYLPFGKGGRDNKECQ